MSIEYCMSMYIVISYRRSNCTERVPIAIHGTIYLDLWVAMQLHELVKTTQIISTYGIAAQSKETVALTLTPSIRSKGPSEANKNESFHEVSLKHQEHRLNSAKYVCFDYWNNKRTHVATLGSSHLPCVRSKVYDCMIYRTKVRAPG